MLLRPLASMCYTGLPLYFNIYLRAVNSHKVNGNENGGVCIPFQRPHGL